MGAVAEPEQDALRRSPRALSSRRRTASGAIPIPPPTRIAPAAPGWTSAGAENGLPSGPVISSRSPSVELGERLGPRADRLEQEAEPRTPAGVSSTAATEKARGR